MRAIRRTRGQALAEFALVLPIFLLIVLALFDLGRAVFVYNGLTNAAREAARLAVVNQDEVLVAQRASTMAIGIGISTAPADLVNFYRPLPDADDVTANPECLPGDTTNPLVAGCVAVVVAQAPWQPITPVIGNIIGPITFEARSELPVEFQCPNPSIAGYATSDLCPKQP